MSHHAAHLTDALAAAWTAAIATVGLLVGAGVTAWYARKAFREQSQEVALLQKQAARDATELRRAQAAKVFVWVAQEPASGPGAFIRVRNSSEQPVYDPEISWADDMEPTRNLTLGGAPCMPGETYALSTGLADPVPAVRLDFRDAMGVRWRTTSRGELTELP